MNMRELFLSRSTGKARNEILSAHLRPTLGSAYLNYDARLINGNACEKLLGVLHTSIGGRRTGSDAWYRPGTCRSCKVITRRVTAMLNSHSPHNARRQRLNFKEEIIYLWFVSSRGVSKKNLPRPPRAALWKGKKNLLRALGVVCEIFSCYHPSLAHWPCPST